MSTVVTEASAAEERVRSLRRLASGEWYGSLGVLVVALVLLVVRTARGSDLPWLGMALIALGGSVLFVLGARHRQEADRLEDLEGRRAWAARRSGPRVYVDPWEGQRPAPRIDRPAAETTEGPATPEPTEHIEPSTRSDLPREQP